MIEATKLEVKEVVIAGGGMVGMGCALALAQAGIESVLLESQSIDSDQVSKDVDDFDDRTLVVNPASELFWQNLGVWPELAGKLTPINKVHVSNQGHFGTVSFDAAQQKVSHLGQVVAAKDLAAILWQMINDNPKITVLSPAKLQSFEQLDGGIKVEVESDNQTQQIHAQLLIAADGARSGIREQLALPTTIKSYQRKALVCNVTLANSHNNTAYERLTKTGPLALLPFKSGRYGLVWSVTDQQADELLELPDDDLKAEIELAMGPRLGRISTLGNRSHYPLYQVKVAQQITPHVVLIGNAAHSVSPVSAQGLNLAVRGIKRLVDVLSEAKQSGQSLADYALLQQYQESSEADQESTMNYTDDLMRWFQIDTPIVNGLRSAGLLLIDSVPGLKRHLFLRAGGLKA